jgi:hypothetical protein
LSYAEVQTGAWVRDVDTTYGHNKYPFGRCSTAMGGAMCPKPACHRIPHEGAKSGYRVVCRAHLPKHIIFCPYMGQQEKLFAADERYVLGGGGAGPGKTYVGWHLFLKQWHGEQQRYLAAQSKGQKFYSKGRALFLRRTIPEVKQVIAEFRQEMDSGKVLDPGAVWNEQDKTCTFPNGYTIHFGGMENDADYLKYYGREFTLIVIDEAVQFTEKQIKEVDSRIRCADPDFSAPLQLYLLTNPVGPTPTAAATKAWLKVRFVKRAAPEEPVRLRVKIADGRIIDAWQVYIPCNVYDNPALMEDGEYEANLTRKGAAMKQALLFNNWDLDEGAWVGDDWDATVHVVDPFTIPKGCPKYKAGDYAYGEKSRHMSAVGWFAVLPEGNHVAYRWKNFKGLTAKEMAARIKVIESQPLTWFNKKTGKTVKIVDVEWDVENDVSTVLGPMDASCWSKQGEGENGESRGEQFEAAGCGFYPSAKGTKERHDAADHIRFRLRQRTPDLQGSLDPGWPGLMFFRETTETKMPDGEGGTKMVGPIHSIPVLPFDENDPDVWDTEAGDDDMDTLGYGELSRPPGGERDEAAEVLDFIQTRHPVAPGRERISW